MVPPIQLFTVSSPEFLLGTRVMLHSFLAHNRWFDGELIVLHTRLSARDEAVLMEQFKRLRCIRASVILDSTINRLVDGFPHLANRRDRFLSLDLLMSSATGSRLFLDSDVLVCGDIGELCQLPGEFVACPDANMLRGQFRGADGCTGAEHNTGTPDASSFNAGMLLLDGVACSDELADRALAQLAPENWQSVTSDHTDQAVWNRLFQDEVTMADSRFNFMVGHESLYDEGIDRDALRLLHFNGPNKPWLPQTHMQQRDGFAAWANESWRQACQQMLSDSGK